MTASAESTAAGRAVQRRFPDFFIVGHAKSGTTALYEMLRRHPQLYLPPVKEPQYFARNPNPPAGGARKKAFEQTGRRPETLERYLSLFAPARPEQLVGEASTFYLWSPLAAGRIADARPDARIIAIFREPASFLHSLHLQMVQNHAESEKDLRRAIALEDARRQGRKIPRNAHWPQALMYTDRVRYVEQLRRFHEAFGADQVLALIYDDFRADNEATLRRVLSFLEVDDSVSLEATEANPTVAVRSIRLDGMMRSMRAARGPVSRALKGTVKGLTTGAMRRNVLYPFRRRLLYGEPPALDPALEQELRDRFQGEVAALGEYLNRDLLALWGYDGGR
jgi:Sulfotransferase family